MRLVKILYSKSAYSITQVICCQAFVCLWSFTGNAFDVTHFLKCTLCFFSTSLSYKTEADKQTYNNRDLTIIYKNLRGVLVFAILYKELYRCFQFIETTRFVT